MAHLANPHESYAAFNATAEKLVGLSEELVNKKRVVSQILAESKEADEISLALIHEATEIEIEIEHMERRCETEHKIFLADVAMATFNKR